tara:strand:+ start:260 stop:1246 length:987 start_codon:yes stop_codon:yes gene_type:complete
MKILLTGGAGYIGSVVLRQLLEKKHLVYCLDILKFGRDSINSINDPNFKFFQIDINQIDEFNYFLNTNKFDAVIHLAAIVGDPACKLYSEEAYQTNWTSTKNLIDQCIITKVEKFIFASTCSNYGKMYDSNEILNENADLKPLSLYAELKVKCEEYILNQIDKSNKFFPTILRFATVYGLSPRMRYDLTVNEFTKDLTLKRKLLVYGKNFWRPYCHVNDFGRAFIKVLESKVSDVSYNVFNVGDTSENYTKEMIIDNLKKIIPHPEIDYVTQENDPRDYKVNCDKIRNTINFKISKTLIDGIKEINYFINQNKEINTEDQKYYNIPHD